MDLGPWELILILGIVLVIFGGAKLPEIGKNMGKAMSEFRKASKGEDDAKSKTGDAKAAAQSEQTKAQTEQTKTA